MRLLAFAVVGLVVMGSSLRPARAEDIASVASPIEVRRVTGAVVFAEHGPVASARITVLVRVAPDERTPRFAPTTPEAFIERALAERGRLVPREIARGTTSADGRFAVDLPVCALTSGTVVVVAVGAEVRGEPAIGFERMMLEPPSDELHGFGWFGSRESIFSRSPENGVLDAGEVRLRAQKRASVLVRGAGAPLAGARVAFNWGGCTSSIWVDVETDAAGVASILADADSVTAFVGAEGWAHAFQRVSTVVAEPVVVDLQPGACVVGRVLDADGVPAARYDVCAHPDEKVRERLQLPRSVSTTADRAGHYELSGLFPGVGYTLRVLPRSAFELEATHSFVAGPKRTVDLSLAAAGRILFEVDTGDSTNAPKPEELAHRLFREDAATRRWVLVASGSGGATRPDGGSKLEKSLDRIVPGTYRVSVQVSGRGAVSQPFVVVGGETARARLTPVEGGGEAPDLAPAK